MLCDNCSKRKCGTCVLQVKETGIQEKEIKVKVQKKEEAK